MKLNNKGITLIALVITIIVMLILAGVTINLTIGENGIFTTAKEAKEKQKISEYLEKIELAKGEVALKNIGEVTLDNLLEQIYEDEIFLGGKIEQVDSDRIQATTKEGYIFIIGTTSATYAGTGKIDSEKVNPKVNIEISAVNNKHITIKIKGESYVATIKNYKVYIGGQLEKTIDSSEKEVTAEVSTNFGITSCYVEIEDKLGNKGISEEKQIEDYEIGSLDELKIFRDSVNSGNSYEGKTITQVADTIDLQCNESNQWTPIGNVNHLFKGTYNGNNKIIKKIYINKPDESRIGLFGRISGNIENLTLDSGTIVGKDYVGGICGSIVDSGSISNCINKATISGNSYIGGITGLSSVEITNCKNYGQVSAKNNYIGGIVGAQSASKVFRCINVAKISSDADMIGGIVGVLQDTGGIIEQCCNCGSDDKSIEGRNYIGGIVGEIIKSSGGSVISCYNLGQVKANGLVAGGIVGSNSDTVENSYSIGDVLGDFNGALVGENIGTIKNSYALTTNLVRKKTEKMKPKRIVILKKHLICRQMSSCLC